MYYVNTSTEIYIPWVKSMTIRVIKHTKSNFLSEAIFVTLKIKCKKLVVLVGTDPGFG